MSGLHHVLLGMCNPLLDISANVEEDFLKKYEVGFSSLWEISAIDLAFRTAPCGMYP